MKGPVLVTGAASGMGRRLAERWSSRGLDVVGVDVQGELLRRMQDDGILVAAEVVDVSDAKAVQEAVDRITDAVGPIGTLVNAAGIIRTGSFANLQPDDFRAVIEVNYLGTVNFTFAILPAMRGAGTGTIVNFASLAGWMPTPLTSAYTASKFAVVGFTETLAIELRGSGVQVIATCPPAVDTPMLASIRNDPEIPPRITKLAPAITADTVIDGIERGLVRGRLFVFPGPGSSTLWRLRRFAPRFLRWVNRVMYGL